MFSPLSVPFRQTPQLDVQQSGLDRVQSSVVAFHVVVILLCLAVIAQHLDFVGNASIIRSHCTCFAARSQILSRDRS